MVYRWTYAVNLPAEARKRYLEKIGIIGDLDPFAGSLGECTEAVPPVDASDLVPYLVLQTSFLTAMQVKAHKSWSRTINWCVAGSKKSVLAKKFESLS